MRILVVDDSAMMVDIASDLLASMGHDPVPADGGVAASQLLNQSEYDLVITDVNMPDMDGFELVNLIRADARHQAIPVILLTGDASDAFAGRCQQAGVSAWLKKPFSPDELKRQIGRFVFD
jgi:CheY-like chemotaxis protein